MSSSSCSPSVITLASPGQNLGDFALGVGTDPTGAGDVERSLASHVANLGVCVVLHKGLHAIMRAARGNINKKENAHLRPSSATV